MVLVQISVTTSNNGTYIPINLTGVRDVRITAIQYHSTDAAGTVKIIGINTDKLRLSNSQFGFPIFMNNSQTNYFGFDSSFQEYQFHGVDFDGRIFINVIDTATGSAPANFTNLVLTLSVEQLKC
jgi:hypothetical protein